MKSENRKGYSLIYLFLLISLAITQVANATNNIDQLLEKANKIRTSDPGKFSQLLTQLESNSEKLTTQQHFYLKYLKAYKLTFSGKTTEGLVQLKNILASEKADMLIQYRARLTIINIYAIQQNWTEGLSQLSHLLEESKRVTDKETILNGFMIPAIFYNQLEQYEIGLKYAKLLFDGSTSERKTCIAKTLIIESKLHLKTLATNDSEIQEGMKLCRNEGVMRNFIRSYQAKFNLEKEQPILIIDSLLPHLTEIEATKYPRLIVEIYTSLAQAYWLQNDYKNAKLFAEKSTLIGSNIKTTQAVVAAYKLLYQIAKAQSYPLKALKLHETYAELDKTYVNEIKAKYLAFQLAEHKAIEQKNKIDLLNERNALLTAEQALIRANVENTRLMVMVLALTLSVLMFWGYRLLKAHRRIKELAEFDGLTGIYNRGHFTVVANKALEYCQSAEQELSLIMFDLDYFKKINDNYGHACGDWALKETVAACKSISRQNDIFARLGGEEFCILLTSCNISSALERAESYRKAIEKISSQGSGNEFSITASFGVTDAKTSGYDLETILADADTAAYTSKHNGRNQVTLFTQPESPQKAVPLDNTRDVF